MWFEKFKVKKRATSFDVAGYVAEMWNCTGKSRKLSRVLIIALFSGYQKLNVGTLSYFVRNLDHFIPHPFQLMFPQCLASQWQQTLVSRFQFQGSD